MAPWKREKFHFLCTASAPLSDRLSRGGAEKINDACIRCIFSALLTSVSPKVVSLRYIGNEKKCDSLCKFEKFAYICASSLICQ